jgi:branched-chain amino acid aminotransferase
LLQTSQCQGVENGGAVTIYYVDGRFVPADRAMIPVDDLAVLRGLGVFDFLRTYGGRPFYLRRHLQRLQRSAELTGLRLPCSLDALEDIVQQTLARNDHPESNIRIVVTGGSSPDCVTPKGNERLIVMVTPVAVVPESWYRQGVKIILEPSQRTLPGAKSTNYLSAILALRRAGSLQAVEAVYVDADDRVREGTTSNIFAFAGGTLFTPADAILPGITRGLVLDLCQGLFPVRVGDLTVAALLKADEVFLTSSNREVLPVVQVDDAVIGDGRPGKLTRRTMAAFGDHVRGYAVKPAANSR